MGVRGGVGVTGFLAIDLATAGPNICKGMLGSLSSSAAIDLLYVGVTGCDRSPS